MAKAKNSASKSKKADRAIHKKASSRRTIHDRPRPPYCFPFLPGEAFPRYFQIVLHGWQRCNTLIL